MVKILPFGPTFRTAFKELNYAWIEQYFKVESSDRIILEDPEGEILQKGGAILIATLHDEPVGTCALIRVDDNHFELAKMAVAAEARGHKIGWQLGIATLEKAKELGAKKVHLDTNSTLTPAINLYKKLGFKEVPGRCSDYERCNVQMEIELD